MDLCDEGLISAFGPFGRMKVIENLIGGSLTVTKDGQQIIDCYLSDPTHKKSLQSIVVRACSTVSSESGDGSMASLIVVNSLMRLLQRSMLSSNPNANRIFQLKAIENIILTMESKRLCINQYMLDASVWQSVSYQAESNNLYLFLRGFWGSILQPATNSATASFLGAILVRSLAL
jgi:TCP-1/cpn60 chaperonin family